MQLEFPRNVAHQVRLVGAVRQVVQHVVGNLPVHEVLHDPVTRKLIVRLHDEVSVEELKVSRRWGGCAVAAVWREIVCHSLLVLVLRRCNQTLQPCWR